MPLKIKKFFILVICLSIFWILLSALLKNSPLEFYDIPLLSYLQRSLCRKRLQTAKPFFKKMPPNYGLSEEEIVDFYKILAKTFPKENQAKFQKFFKVIQEASQEGFFIIVKHTQRQPDTLKDALENWYVQSDNESAAVIIHEFTHSGRFPCFFENESCPKPRLKPSKTLGERKIESYSLAYDDPEYRYKTAVWVEDKAIGYGYELVKLFPANRINLPLVTYSSFDKRLDQIYFQDRSLRLNVLLDEINAYTKISKIMRELNCSGIKKKVDSYYFPHILSRHLYHLAIYLEYAKDNEPETWEYISENKVLTYILMKLGQRGEKEASLAINDKKNRRINMESSPEGIKHNLDLFKKKKNIFSELYNSSGIFDVLDQDLSLEEVIALGINNIKVYVF